MAGRMEYDFTFGKAQAGRKEPGATFRILLLADFSGRRNRGLLEPLAGRKVLKVDVDGFETVLAGLAPQLDLGLAEPVAFAELDDFHPDALYRRLDVFRALAGLRSKLRDPRTFRETAAALGAIPPAAEAPPAPAPKEGDGATFDRLLGRPSRPDVPRAAAGLDAMIKRIVAPHIVPAKDPRQDACVAALDAAISAQMRTVLHHEAFRRLEAAWRGALLVVEAAEAEGLSVHLFDVTKEELAADLRAAGPAIERSGLYRTIVEGQAGTGVWGAVAGAWTFSAEKEDVSLLASLAAVASQAGGPFLAGAEPPLAGTASFAESPDPTDWTIEAPEPWQKLRQSPLAAWIGLAAPRLLLRVPYGRGREEAEDFAFEELSTPPAHEEFLWGSAGFAAAALLARSFAESGEDMEPGDVLDLEDRPACAVGRGDEQRLVPAAEAFLSERAADAMLSRGLMPILSWRDRNVARLVRFQSLALPPAPLRGRWG